MCFTLRTSRRSIVAFRRSAVILASLTAGFGLAYAMAPVAAESSGKLLSPTGYVDTADALSLQNELPGSVHLRGWGVRLDSKPGSVGGDDGSSNTQIHARDHDLSIAAFTFRREILAAIREVPPAGQNLSAHGSNDASITFVCCSYDPTVVTITVGESVSWSGFFASHPLRQVDGPTSDVPVPGGFANSTGSFYSVQFNAPGTFYFHCAFHGLAQSGGQMRGRIVVLRPPTDTPTPTSTRTNTPVPPTNTPTPTSTQTNTPGPPINTPTPTATLTPTKTPTSTTTIAPMDWHLYLPTVNR